MSRKGAAAFALAIAFVSVIALSLVPAAGAVPPPEPAVEVEPILNSNETAAGDFFEVTDVASPPGEPDRLLIVQRPGVIDEQVGGHTSRFLDIESKVAFAANYSGFEKGLWSIAFPADYQTSHSFWAVYTRKREGSETGEPEIQLAEFKTDSQGAVVAGSERVVTRIPHPTIHHYGGQIAFGPEGDLYWSIGDGSTEVSAAAFRAPQDLSSPLGKILRINPRPDGVASFQVPPGNPFASSSNPYTQMVWAYGLRNPWRFAIDSANGDLTIGDVGNLAHEEVDLVAPQGGYRAGRGVNFGWPCREGAHEASYPVDSTDGCPLTPPYVDPVFDYGHESIEGSSHKACAVMGGLIAHEGAPVRLRGRYIYADHCTGQVRSFDPTATDVAATDRLDVPLPTHGPSGELSGEPNTIDTDSCGHVYVGTNLGYVYRLKEAGETLGCPHPETLGPEDPMGAEGPQTTSPPTDGGTGTGSTPENPPTTGGGTPSGPATTSPPPPAPRTQGKSGVTVEIVKHRGKTFVLSVEVTPCTDRPAATIMLSEGDKNVATRKLQGTCSTRFTVRRAALPVTFRAAVAASEGWAAASSRGLRVAPARPHAKASRVGIRL